MLLCLVITVGELATLLYWLPKQASCTIWMSLARPGFAFAKIHYCRDRNRKSRIRCGQCIVSSPFFLYIISSRPSSIVMLEAGWTLCETQVYSEKQNDPNIPLRDQSTSFHGELSMPTTGPRLLHLFLARITIPFR